MPSSSSLNFVDTCYLSDVGSSTQILCYSSAQALYAISFVVITVIMVTVVAIQLVKKSY